MNENTTLATELLHELKQNCKRWFIAFVIMIFVEVATIAGFLWYISLSVEETTDVVTVENDDGNANYIGKDLNGVINNGESNSKENN